MRILALDTETGGLDPNRHAIVSLGLAIMEDAEVIASREFRLGMDSKAEYDVKSLEINGISWKSIKEGPDPKQVYVEAARWLDEHDAREIDIVSHNTAFDAAFISQWAFKCGYWDRGSSCFIPAPELVRGPWWCTRRMASRLKLENYKLDTVCSLYKLARTGEHHGALEDAVLAGKVFAALREKVAA